MFVIQYVYGDIITMRIHWQFVVHSENITLTCNISSNDLSNTNQFHTWKAAVKVYGPSDSSIIFWMFFFAKWKLSCSGVKYYLTLSESSLDELTDHKTSWNDEFAVILDAILNN